MNRRVVILQTLAQYFAKNGVMSKDTYKSLRGEVPVPYRVIRRIFSNWNRLLKKVEFQFPELWQEALDWEEADA